MGMDDKVYRHLENLVGSGFVTRKKEDLVCYSYDAAPGNAFLPDAVVFPKSETQVSEIMRLALKKRIPVIPRGSGSGMTGGAVPVQGGVVLAFSRMNHILDIDLDNFTATVEPGVIVSHLHKAVEDLGLFYPPDPASSDVCTIGGNVGECAGGPRAVKYGVTRDYVLGLRAVLPCGDVISTGVSTAKGVAGYDLTRLIVGSEGTLAVVTGITLRLLPRPACVATLAVCFDDMEKAARTVSGIMRQAVIPRCVEYLDEASLFLVKDRLQFALPKQAKAMLILELDGDEITVKAQTEQIRQFCTQSFALDIRVAKDPGQAAALWEARKALSPVLYKIANQKINEDIVVPISKIPDMVACIKSIQAESGLTIVSFGHAGDGNIHCNIMYDKTDASQAKQAKKAVDRLFAATLELGGTITGEHGVGLTKMAYLSWEIGRVEQDIMKKIKAVFDPFRILNPGKIFPDS
ncbi:MAG: FAD-binding protein [Desulfotignum sp.]|nr:FAD-binding protein [Desulfotignum sp.]MCF8113225.1 FAD-binding protein [Desulfotignum sp.]MCF8126333.1 FAD-binding protein [Desulfotignum sp.]